MGDAVSSLAVVVVGVPDREEPEMFVLRHPSRAKNGEMSLPGYFVIEVI